MSEPAYVAETLAWCNERRVEQGKKPLTRLPKGVRSDGNSCPCGKATGFWVGGKTYRATAFSDSLGFVPHAVTDFVGAFDNGELPQYEASR